MVTRELTIPAARFVEIVNAPRILASVPSPVGHMPEDARPEFAIDESKTPGLVRFTFNDNVSMSKKRTTFFH